MVSVFFMREENILGEVYKELGWIYKKMDRNQINLSFSLIAKF